jgi:hypothetical protein
VYQINTVKGGSVVIKLLQDLVFSLRYGFDLGGLYEPGAANFAACKFIDVDR